MSATTREILTRQGAHPNAKIEDPPPFDLIAWRIEQARTVLTRRTPPRFADAQATDPDLGAWARRYIADPAQPPIVLAGPTGVGKTWQAYGALRTIVEGLANRGLGLNWRATNHPDLNDKLRPKPDGSHTWALDPYLETDLLLLDDLGAGRQTEWTGDSLYRLVDHRWANDKPTIYSTNLNATELTAIVGDRVVSRLADAQRITIKGEDRRWSGATR
jgi:DNA replication protein DnaC